MCLLQCGQPATVAIAGAGRGCIAGALTAVLAIGVAGLLGGAFVAIFFSTSLNAASTFVPTFASKSSRRFKLNNRSRNSAGGRPSEIASSNSRNNKF